MPSKSNDDDYYLYNDYPEYNDDIPPQLYSESDYILSEVEPDPVEYETYVDNDSAYSDGLIEYPDTGNVLI